MKKPTETIFELTVYDGSQKVFRVLNINTGTVYSCEYETKKQADRSIEHGKMRAGYKVRRVMLPDLHLAISNYTMEP